MATTKKQNMSKSSVQSSTKGNLKRAKQNPSTTDSCIYNDPHTMSAEAILEELIVFVEDYNKKLGTEFQLPDAVYCWNWYNPARRDQAEAELRRLALNGSLSNVCFVKDQQLFGGQDHYIIIDHIGFRAVPDTDNNSDWARYYNMSVEDIFWEFLILGYKYHSFHAQFTLAEDHPYYRMFEPTRRKIAERKFKATVETGTTHFGLVKDKKRKGMDLYFRYIEEREYWDYNPDDCTDEDSTDEDKLLFNLEPFKIFSEIRSSVVARANSSDMPFTLSESVRNWNKYEISNRKWVELDFISLVVAGELEDIHIVDGEKRNGDYLFTKCPSEEYYHNLSAEGIVRILANQTRRSHPELNGNKGTRSFTLQDIEPRWRLFDSEQLKSAEYRFKRQVLCGAVPAVKLSPRLEGDVCDVYVWTERLQATPEYFTEIQ